MALLVDIEKSLGSFSLQVSFEAQDRELLALLGASGCGKSMTLKCVAGLEKPDRGRIVLNGRTLFDSEKRIDLSPQQRRVGYLFQQYALFPNMTVLQNVLTGARRKPEAERRARDMIAAMQLKGLEDKRPKQLSGGQQQRVALARILVNEPELILLDEPFSALDDYLKWQLELELGDALRAFGRTALFVSHSRDEVYRLCDRVCVLTRGRSEPVQPVKAMFEQPGSRSACILSGCKNYSRFHPLPGGKVWAEDWGAELRPQRSPGPEDAWLGLRSHYIRVAEGPGENRIECTVERVIDDVFSTVVLLKTPGGGVLRLETEKAEWQRHEGAKKLCIFAAPHDIMVLTD